MNKTTYSSTSPLTTTIRINNEKVGYVMLLDHCATLIQLLRIGGEELRDNTSAQELHDLLQERFLMQGKLRAEILGRMPTEEELALLTRLGFVDAIHATITTFGGVLIPGATLKATMRRVQYMLRELPRDYDFPVYCLGSGRLLLPAQESPNCVPTMQEETGLILDPAWKNAPWPKDETGVMQFVTAFAGLPEEWQCFFHTTPLNAGGKTPTTPETIKQFLKEYQGLTGLYLLVSSQPFAQYQLLTVRRAIKEAGRNITVDLMAPQAPPLPLARYLDNIAKQLYEELKR